MCSKGVETRMNKKKQEKLLNEYRSQMSRDKHIKVFKVFTSENIKDVLDAQPHSLEELSRVKGFPKGGKRIQQYGEAIVDIITRCNEIENIHVHAATDGSPKMEMTLKQMNLF